MECSFVLDLERYRYELRAHVRMCEEERANAIEGRP
jgi:hypothetical protein